MKLSCCHIDARPLDVLSIDTQTVLVLHSLCNIPLSFVCLGPLLYVMRKREGVLFFFPLSLSLSLINLSHNGETQAHFIAVKNYVNLWQGNLMFDMRLVIEMT